MSGMFCRINAFAFIRITPVEEMTGGIMLLPFQGVHYRSCATQGAALG